MREGSEGLRATALEAWVGARAAGLDHAGACAAVVAALDAGPWAILAAVTPLARSPVAPAPEDLALDARLRRVPPGSRSAVVRFAAGAPCPAPDPASRKARGAFDTPPDLARRTVALALAAAQGPVAHGLDPACGTGSFLLALREAGVPVIEGYDLDPVALAVAGALLPGARLSLRDGLEPGPPVDLVVGNPPFVPPERQERSLRRALATRFPWLAGRYDLAVPFAAAAADRLRPGGGLGLLLPAPLLVQPYGHPLRVRWLRRHRISALPVAERFPGASVDVVSLALCAGAGPGPVAPHGIPAEEVLALPAAPLCAYLRPGDGAVVARVRAASVILGSLCEVDTGVVVHGAGHRREALLRDAFGPDCVPYADAADLMAGRRRWLALDPARMHRAKRPTLFAAPKLLVPRVVGGRPLRCVLDEEGLWVGHTLNVLRPREGQPVPLARLQALIESPLTRGLLRIERGERLDVYPRDLRELPVPRAWLDGAEADPAEAWGLAAADRARLEALGRSNPVPG
jgi:SAM-dependent methyltransferase